MGGGGSTNGLTYKIPGRYGMHHQESSHPHECQGRVLRSKSRMRVCESIVDTCATPPPTYYCDRQLWNHVRGLCLGACLVFLCAYAKLCVLIQGWRHPHSGIGSVCGWWCWRMWRDRRRWHHDEICAVVRMRMRRTGTYWEMEVLLRLGRRVIRLNHWIGLNHCDIFGKRYANSWKSLRLYASKFMDENHSLWLQPYA